MMCSWLLFSLFLWYCVSPRIVQWHYSTFMLLTKQYIYKKINKWLKIIIYPGCHLRDHYVHNLQLSPITSAEKHSEFRCWLSALVFILLCLSLFINTVLLPAGGVLVQCAAHGPILQRLFSHLIFNAFVWEQKCSIIYPEAKHKDTGTASLCSAVLPSKSSLSLIETAEEEL